MCLTGLRSSRQLPRFCVWPRNRIVFFPLSLPGKIPVGGTCKSIPERCTVLIARSHLGCPAFGGKPFPNRRTTHCPIPSQPPSFPARLTPFDPHRFYVCTHSLATRPPTNMKPFPLCLIQTLINVAGSSVGKVECPVFPAFAFMNPDQSLRTPPPLGLWVFPPRLPASWWSAPLEAW